MSPMNGILVLFVAVHSTEIEESEAIIMRHSTPESTQSDNDGTSDLSNPSNAQCDEWKSFLKQWNLDQFSAQFEERGWTDVNDWNHIDDDELNAMGLHKGHIFRFHRNVANWQQNMAEERKDKKREIDWIGPAGIEIYGLCDNQNMQIVIYSFVGYILALIFSHCVTCRDYQRHVEKVLEYLKKIDKARGITYYPKADSHYKNIMKVNGMPYRGYDVNRGFGFVVVIRSFGCGLGSFCLCVFVLRLVYYCS